MVATTLRLPEELHEELKKWAKEEGRSVNELAVEVLEREARRHKGLQVLENMRQLRERLRAEYGMMEDSTPIIRQLREERSQRG